jgi:hypothetical protein
MVLTVQRHTDRAVKLQITFFLSLDWSDPEYVFICELREEGQPIADSLPTRLRETYIHIQLWAIFQLVFLVILLPETDSKRLA